MLINFNSIILEKKTLHKDYSMHNINHKNNSFISVLNNLKKCLLNKEIEFDNISTKKKKIITLLYLQIL